jgi:hypothetical protein
MKAERKKMHPKTTRRVEITPDGLFRSLVDNALEFLETASVQIKQFPKQSLLNFAAGLELFMKARLLHEHWALILDKPEKAKLESLHRGDFKSVTSMEAIDRLKNIAGQTITDYERGAFQELTEHRNKVVHFFDPSYTLQKEDSIRKVMTEQLHAWFYLHRLLTIRWKAEFAYFEKKIRRIDLRLKRNSAYLEGKYRALQPEIEAEKKKGKEFAKCGVCSFEASRLDNLGEPLFQYECLVCSTVKTFLLVPCPHCGEPVTIEDMGEGECSCGYEVSLSDLIEKYGGYRDPKEDPTEIYCSQCSSDGVVEHGEGYLCLSCLSQFKYTAKCQWCATEIAGFDSRDSYVLGCVLCDGRYDKD